MKNHRNRNESRLLDGGGGRDAAGDAGRADVESGSYPAGGGRDCAPDGDARRRDREDAANSEWFAAFADGHPRSGGEDKPSPPALDDGERRAGGAGHGRVHRGEGEPWLSEEDGEDLCFGRRRPQDCALDFLGGTYTGLHLGDGEDLP